MPTKPLPDYARRSERLSFALTRGQYEVWESAAKAAHLSLPDWIRRAGDSTAKAEAKARTRDALEAARARRESTSENIETPAGS